MITIKTQREIELMRKAGWIVALCHQRLAQIIEPGITTNQLNAIVEKIILENDGIPAFKGLYGFPGSICASPNDQVVHGIPNDVKLVEGDIISIDIGVKYQGYCGDSAWTYPVGKVSPAKELLLRETENSLWAGLNVIKEKIHLSDVSHAIEQHAKQYNLGIVREFAGHGLGSDLHEEPEILNYRTSKQGPLLFAGMTLAIEPMLNLGSAKVKIHNDGWTTTTIDHKASAHFEHSIVVTATGYEILTTL